MDQTSLAAEDGASYIVGMERGCSEVKSLFTFCLVLCRNIAHVNDQLSKGQLLI